MFLIFIASCIILPYVAMFKLRKHYRHDRWFVQEMTKGISMMTWFWIANAIFLIVVYG